MLKPPRTLGDPLDPTADHRGWTRREAWIAAMGVLALGLVAWWYFASRVVPPPEPLAAPTLTAPAAMARLNLDQLPPLPDESAIAEANPAVIAALARRERPSLLVGFDAAALAWAEHLLAADRVTPSIPQRISGSDLQHRGVEPGSDVALRGRLDDLLLAPVDGREDAGYRWLSLALPDEQYALVLAPAGAALVLNIDVQATGRYLGQLPVGDVMIDLVMARAVTELTSESGLATISADLREFHGRVIDIPDLYAQVNDEAPLVETRAYYHTLGRVAQQINEPPPADQLDANVRANELHQQPSAFRGRAVRMVGHVYHAWEDAEVAADQPYAVQRVVRVLMYHRDTSLISIEGQNKTKQVLRLFEIAAITAQPLPKPGEYLTADGVFVKWRAIPVDHHPEMDRLAGVQRASSKCYALFSVTGPWRTMPVTTIDTTALQVALSIGAVIFVLLIGWWLHRDRSAERRLQESLIRMRQQRRTPKPPVELA